jgi:hypothetical protein
MTARQGELLERPKRKTRGQIMHVCDAGCGEGKPVVQFQCPKCEYQSDWFTFDTVTEARRGLPCPRCAMAPAERQSPEGADIETEHFHYDAATRTLTEK